jgi:hypothetical protein
MDEQISRQDGRSYIDEPSTLTARSDSQPQCTPSSSGSSVVEDAEDVSPAWSEDEIVGEPQSQLDLSDQDDETWDVEDEDWELADGGESPRLHNAVTHSQISQNTTTDYDSITPLCLLARGSPRCPPET